MADKRNKIFNRRYKIIIYYERSIFIFKWKTKINMIIYNRQLQKILGVDIKVYKKISGKYKIVEKNGKGREYILNGDKLIFEGEFLNGKRNGKRKNIIMMVN